MELNDFIIAFPTEYIAKELHAEAIINDATLDQQINWFKGMKKAMLERFEEKIHKYEFAFNESDWNDFYYYGCYNYC